MNKSKKELLQASEKILTYTRLHTAGKLSNSQVIDLVQKAIKDIKHLLIEIR